jgi:drug/metabolite transporter (DMT)-like permease
MSNAALAWYFVLVWGVGFVATKAGLQYAAPFTFLSLRFAFGIVILLPLLLWLKPRWPEDAREWTHVVVAGVLMHAVHLSGSHYSQYLGLSAGVTAVVLALQPLATALIATRFFDEQLHARQWLGVAIGFGGVAAMVGYKIDVHAITLGGLCAVLTGLAALTAATLYQRRFCPTADLRSAALIQFAASLVVTLPLAIVFEGARIVWHPTLFASIAFLVIGASIFAVSALHTLMRRGAASRVANMLYLPPVVAVLAEWALFDVVPTLVTLAGVVVTGLGVYLAVSGPKPTSKKTS